MKKNNSEIVSMEDQIQPVLAGMEQSNIIPRIWEHDATLWKTDEAHQQVIKNRLGWLKSVDWLVQETENLITFQKDIAACGFKHAVLLGMGGSSLAPEVLRQTFGAISGYPQLIVLDSTVADQVLKVQQSIDISKTIFIVSTKSGTTLETLSFYHYFYEQVKALKGDKAGEHFIAITDSGTPLEKEANELAFKKVFINPTDIGGRFSVLSYFGIVPAAVMGIDVRQLIGRLKEEVDSSVATIPANNNAGAKLGALIAEAEKQGRDKLTLVVSGSIASYGLWAEQLLAESLGKEGKGIVPVCNEALEVPSMYGNDRIFISLSCRKETDADTEKKLQKLEDAEFPVARISLADSYDLGRQFYRWAFATAVMGTFLGVNPFDEPNVQEAKDWTKKFLDELKKHGKFVDRPPHVQGEKIAATFGAATFKKMKSENPDMKQFLRLVKRGDYINLAAYLPYDSKTDAFFQSLRFKIRVLTKSSTMFGYGPRYLHSTGQLHKGGPNSCIMLLITSDIQNDAKIPGQTFSFGELAFAQALGDFHALNAKGRRAVHIHLKHPLQESFKELDRWFM